MTATQPTQARALWQLTNDFPRESALKKVVPLT